MYNTQATVRRNSGIQASKPWDGVYSSAGSLDATACDATRVGSVGDFGVVAVGNDKKKGREGT